MNCHGTKLELLASKEAVVTVVRALPQKACQAQTV